MIDPRLARPTWRGRTNVDALTIACLERAERAAGHQFTVTQGSYQPPGGGDINSAGTHNGGGVIDLRWCGHDACIGHLRRAGFWAWHRTPEQSSWPHHVHAGVLGHPLLAPLAKVQEQAYRDGYNGLGYNGRNAPDDGPRIVPIPVPLWIDAEPQRGPLKPIRKDVQRAARKADRANRPGLAARLRRFRDRHLKTETK